MSQCLSTKAGQVHNLNVHSATDVLLFALAHPRWEFVFQPKYAAYLNLERFSIEFGKHLARG